MNPTSSHRPRQTAAQWHQIVEAQLASGLSSPKFCEEKNISYASFINWKKKLSVSPPKPAQKLPAFIELTPDPGIEAPTAVSTTGHSVCIELDLGAGVHLRISRAG